MSFYTVCKDTCNFSIIRKRIRFFCFLKILSFIFFHKVQFFRTFVPSNKRFKKGQYYSIKYKMDYANN